MSKIIFILCIFLSFSTHAEILQLIPPIEGAKSYEILLFSYSTNKSYTFKLKTTSIRTEKIPSGEYDYQLRYEDQQGTWSDWSDKAKLKIKKKPKLVSSNNNFPMTLSLGLSNLDVDLRSQNGKVKNSESLLTGRFYIAKDSYKLRFNYNTNSNFSRLDMALVKDIMNHLSVGGSFWMVNYSTQADDGNDIMANLSQGFGEVDYHYDWNRFSFFLRGGMSLGLNYFIRPELSFRLPFLENYNPRLSFAYEVSRIDQSNIIYNLSGTGIMVSSNLSVSF